MLYKHGAPPCATEKELYFSPVDDGRTEDGRVEREALAGILCMSCRYRVECLETALVNREDYGVWGGMAEGERREFKTHLISEGYKRNKYPSGKELYHAIKTFYWSNRDTPLERLHRSEVVDVDGDWSGLVFDFDGDSGPVPGQRGVASRKPQDAA